jgi:hypothetical protein
VSCCWVMAERERDGDSVCWHDEEIQIIQDVEGMCCSVVVFFLLFHFISSLLEINIQLAKCVIQDKLRNWI